MVWLDLAWIWFEFGFGVGFGFRLVWFCFGVGSVLVWFGLVSDGLRWFGHVRFGWSSFSLAWFGSGWVGVVFEFVDVLAHRFLSSRRFSRRQLNDVDAQRGPGAKTRIKERFLSQVTTEVHT